MTYSLRRSWNCWNTSVTDSDRKAQPVAFNLNWSITIRGERERERERERELDRQTERGVVKDRSNTKFGPSFMWTAKRSYIAHRPTAASHRKLALVGFPAQVIAIKTRVIPFFQEKITKPRWTSLSLPYGSWYQEFSWDLWHPFWKLITKIDWSTRPLPVFYCTKSTKVMYQLWCYYQP